MESPFDPIAPLREALAASPDNVPLRRHLADQLARLTRFEEAELEYRDLLARTPDDDGIRLALAQAYLGQGKAAHADILVELVTGRDDPPARAFVILAQIRIAERDFQGARVAFRSACELEPALEASDVAAELGVGPSNPFELEEDLDDLDLGIAPVETQVPGFGGFDALDPARRLELPARPRVSFRDAGGFAAEKSKLSLLVTAPLLRPDLFQAYGRDAGIGTIVFGPPGSGKTHLVRCLAGEAGMHLASLDLRELGEHGRQAGVEPLQGFFDAARRASPCIVLIENLDAFDGAAGEREGGAAMEAVRGLLAEFEGRPLAARGLAIVATTERPWDLDPLFIRPGRFQRAVAIGLPGDVGRREILQRLLDGKPSTSIDLKKLARKASGRTVADLVEIVDVATELALEEALALGDPVPIREKTLAIAIREVPATAAGWYETLRARAAESGLRGSARHLAQVLTRAMRSADLRE
ncbi:ATP-dependent zinc metalloprotease FtsH 3 [Planctomycetes bacterium Poly30]|uniref:ATP-dependent zinc metalloprotease FtsH 3 n=1 Tax=Saltatorellus ferox TaxID=2528018 RepID=A0A518EQW9_9BACT|nr:ATP-dependent zinc metalloprotease FtsH 3 [Planctomycetes bacterium Poly30]